MKLTKDNFKTMGECFDTFNKCETEEDLIEYYKAYWFVVEDAVCEEDKILPGSKRNFGKVFDRVRSNLLYMLGDVSKMRRDYAKKVWWFLYL